MAPARAVRLEPSELQGCYVYDVIHMMMEWMSILCVVELDVIINMPVQKVDEQIW